MGRKCRWVVLLLVLLIGGSLGLLDRQLISDFGDAGKWQNVEGYTEAQPFTLDTLSEMSDYIIRGIVTGRGKSVMISDSNYPYQQVHIRVTETIKGSFNARTLNYLEIGGNKGKTKYTISGIKPLLEGEEVILFLSQDRQSLDGFRYWVWNTAYRVENGEIVVAKQDIGGLAIPNLNLNSQESDPFFIGVPVDDFIAAVRSIVY